MSYSKKVPTRKDPCSRRTQLVSEKVVARPQACRMKVTGCQLVRMHQAGNKLSYKPIYPIWKMINRGMVSQSACLKSHHKNVTRHCVRLSSYPPRLGSISGREKNRNGHNRTVETKAGRELGVANVANCNFMRFLC